MNQLRVNEPDRFYRGVYYVQSTHDSAKMKNTANQSCALLFTEERYRVHPVSPAGIRACCIKGAEFPVGKCATGGRRLSGAP